MALAVGTTPPPPAWSVTKFRPTLQLFNINTQQCGSLNTFTDIGIGHCVESCSDNVKEEFDGGSLTVREEEDWVISAGNREDGAKSWTEH